MKKDLYKWIVVMTAFSFLTISLVSFFGVKGNKTDGMGVRGEVIEAKDDRERRSEDTKVFDMGNHEYRANQQG